MAGHRATSKKADDIIGYVTDLWMMRDFLLCDMGPASGKRGTALYLSLHGKQARFVRWRHSAEGSIDLPSVALVAGHGAEPRDAHDAILTSSQLDTSKTVKGEPLPSGKVSYCFTHTTEKHNTPWAVLDLQAPYGLHSLLISDDCIGKRCANAMFLLIEHSMDGSQWETIYDYNRSYNQFVDFLARRLVAFSGDERQLAAHTLINEIVVLLFACKFAGAVKLLKSAQNVSSDVKENVILALNAVVLPQYGVEWSSHGIFRTFRYWTDAEKVSYLQFADDLIVTFHDLLGIDACMGYGAVLSVVRDRQLMPHDDDLDLLAAFPAGRYPTFQVAKQEAKRLLLEQGYDLRAEGRGHFKVQRDGTKPLDVFIGIEEGEFVTWYPGPRKQILRSEVFPPTASSLLGVRCFVPRNAPAYLEKVYGPDWNVPKPRWTHRWRTQQMTDLLETSDAQTSDATQPKN